MTGSSDVPPPTGSNPNQCQWRDCHSTFDGGEANNHLYKHLTSHFAVGQKSISCEWSGCTAKPQRDNFYMRIHIQKHAPIGGCLDCNGGCGEKLTNAQSRTSHHKTCAEMLKRRGKKTVETESENEEQTGAECMSTKDGLDPEKTAELQEEHEYENNFSMHGHDYSPDPYRAVNDTSVPSTDERVLPPSWLPGILSDGARFWYTRKRFSGPMLKETPTQVSERYVLDEGTQRWMLPG